MRCGDGVLGVSSPRQGCRAGDGVLGVPGARGRVQSQRGAVLCTLEYGELRRGSVRCSDGVLAVPGGCAKGGEPACSCARPRAAF